MSYFLKPHTPEQLATLQDLLKELDSCTLPYLEEMRTELFPPSLLFLRFPGLANALNLFFESANYLLSFISDNETFFRLQLAFDRFSNKIAKQLILDKKLTSQEFDRFLKDFNSKKPKNENKSYYLLK